MTSDALSRYLPEDILTLHGGHGFWNSVQLQALSWTNKLDQIIEALRKIDIKIAFMGRGDENESALASKISYPLCSNDSFDTNIFPLFTFGAMPIPANALDRV